jgi:hypothetical protein
MVQAVESACMFLRQNIEAEWVLVLPRAATLTIIRIELHANTENKSVLVHADSWLCILLKPLVFAKLFTLSKNYNSFAK